MKTFESLFADHGKAAVMQKVASAGWHTGRWTLELAIFKCSILCSMQCNSYLDLSQKADPV